MLQLRLLARACVAAVLACACHATPANADIVRSWGSNSWGQVGDGSTGLRLTPTAPAATIGNGVTGAALGFGHILVLQDGVVYGWGSTSNNQAGNGQTGATSGPPAYRLDPLAITQLPAGVTAVSAGDLHSLALVGGSVYAWGSNSNGQLGLGFAMRGRNVSTPTAIGGSLATAVTMIEGGYASSYAIKNGGLYAWGSNADYRLGDGTGTDRPDPVALTGAMASGVTAISAGRRATLAVRDGAVYTWGGGYLGDGGTDTTLPENAVRRATPTALTGPLATGATDVAAGHDHSLALAGGHVYAWGLNDFGQLGDGTTATRTTPVEVAGLADVVQVAAAWSSSYALTADGSLWVWGSNQYGALGLGDTLSRSTPTQLLAPAGYRFTSIEASSQQEMATATLTLVPEPTAAATLAGTALLASRRRR